MKIAHLRRQLSASVSLFDVLTISQYKSSSENLLDGLVYSNLISRLCGYVSIDYSIGIYLDIFLLSYYSILELLVIDEWIA